MARRRFKPEEIVTILREAEKNGDVRGTYRKHNICEQTFYRWKRMYGGIQTSEVQRIKHLEKENRDLKQLVGDQALSIQVMKEEMKKRGWI